MYYMYVLKSLLWIYKIKNFKKKKKQNLSKQSKEYCIRTCTSIVRNIKIYFGNFFYSLQMFKNLYQIQMTLISVYLRIIRSYDSFNTATKCNL